MQGLVLYNSLEVLQALMDVLIDAFDGCHFWYLKWCFHGCLSWCPCWCFEGLYFYLHEYLNLWHINALIYFVINASTYFLMTDLLTDSLLTALLMTVFVILAILILSGFLQKYKPAKNNLLWLHKGIRRSTLDACKNCLTPFYPNWLSS